MSEGNCPIPATSSSLEVIITAVFYIIQLNYNILVSTVLSSPLRTTLFNHLATFQPLDERDVTNADIGET